MSQSKKYWKGLEELQETPEFIKNKHNEFPEELPVDALTGASNMADTSANRRDFLKFLGFSVTAASLAACEAPVKKAIPYLNKPEDLMPGVANYYASTYWDGNDFASLLVKTREGRPIKVDGNDLCPITKGGSNARIQASVLSLYDSNRLKGPQAAGKEKSWSDLDKDVKSKLESIKANGGNIRILSSTLISPSLKSAITEFSAVYPSTKLIQYDTLSASAMISANQASFGKAVLPTYRFDKADYVVGIGCDFMSNWINPVEYSRQYAEKRKLNPKDKNMSKHVQIESILSLTGSNADKRIALKPSELGISALQLLNKLSGSSLSSKSLGANDAAISALASELNNFKGKALVVCGINNPAIQQVVNAINTHLGAYGATIDLDTPDFTRQGNDTAVAELVSELNAGTVDALFIYNTNPAYTYPGFAAALAKAKLSVYLGDRADETGANCQMIAPDHHYLEAWSDSNPRKGIYTLGQPTISPLFKTRQAIESFLTWAGNTTNAHDYISKYWENNVFSSVGASGLFTAFWNKSLHDGVISGGQATTPVSPNTSTANTTANTAATPVAPVLDLSAAAAAIVSKAGQSKGHELVVYATTGIGNGNQANNPWLQEFPDPITRVTWDNYLLMNPEEMNKNGFNTLNGQEQEADVVELTNGKHKIQIPVLAQPGIPMGVIGVALGYGRKGAGKTAEGIGQNAYPFLNVENGYLTYETSGASFGGSVGKFHLACTQTHHTMMGRDRIVKETTLAEYRKDSTAGNEPILLATNLKTVGKDGLAKPGELNLWQEFENKNHFWNMSIDLNACNGCGACVIACTAENNVPVVGKDEVRRSREMHWMRIDRYYSSDMTPARAEKEGIGAIDKYLQMEVPATGSNLEVVFQPVMCQHCNHAPCETVCPVLATTHSLEGLNQMTYNRCVGTRYCANNCPYKVRRFNWFRYNENPAFDFNMTDDLGKMVLNPDVTVRSRGVMEKCSMCVQRIQEGKLKAKKDGTRVKDGAVKTACQQSCATGAITFGDFNDAESEIRKAYNNERRYQLLEEVGTKPSVYYLTKVRNKPAEA